MRTDSLFFLLVRKCQCVSISRGKPSIYFLPNIGYVVYVVHVVVVVSMCMCCVSPHVFIEMLVVVRRSGYNRPGLIVDLVSDIRGVNDQAVKARKTGVIVLGGLRSYSANLHRGFGNAGTPVLIMVYLTNGKLHASENPSLRIDLLSGKYKRL